MQTVRLIGPEFIEFATILANARGAPDSLWESSVTNRLPVDGISPESKDWATVFCVAPSISIDTRFAQTI
jgi:hypothetical protein